MLKLLDTATSLSNSLNMKCAEVFCQSEEYFSIVCTSCKMKTFAFDDFLAHFKNVHLHGNEQSDAVNIKVEDEPVQDVFTEEFQPYPGIEIPVPELKFTVPDKPDEAPLWEEDTRQETDESDDDFDSDHEEEDEEYTPMVLGKSAPKKEQPSTLKCPECNKSYKLSKMLEQHMKRCHSTVSDAPAYKCTRCDIVFEKQRALNDHLHKEHAGYPCPQCDKVYKNKESVHIHQFIHSGQRNFKCDVDKCGKAFYNPKQLCSHKRIVHLAERNFICEECGYRTKHKAALIVHKRSHTGEKPFKCKECGKGFASQSLLCEHRPIHSQERPHKCEVCGASFSRQKALYHHKHLHLSVKKYVCKLCNKAYAQAAGLAGHMRQHKADNF